MKLSVSKGNSKIGTVPNLSLPPILTCRTDVPCAADGCYAMKAYRMYPNVRDAWRGNLEYYQADPVGFFNDLILFFAQKNPQRFRLFVGGDFPDENFFIRVCDILSTWSKISCLVFTKRYEWAILNSGRIPSNFNVVLSMWPGLELPAGWEQFPTAWLEEDVRFPVEQTRIVCTGNCVDCSYQCWGALSPQLPVVFKRH